MNKREKQLERLREQNRNFTTGKPPMFTPLERMCRKIRQASIFQLRRWAKSWPTRLAIFRKAHETHCRVLEASKSPWIKSIALFEGAIAYLKAEAEARATNTPNTCDPSRYELDATVQLS